MATSRYLSPSAASNTTDSRVLTSETGAQTGTTSQQQTSTGTTNQTQTTNSKTTNMSASAQRALDALIKQLQGGGTPEMRAQQAQRDAVIADTRGAQAGYSKTAAFADAQGLISQQMRRALESLLPAISRAAEDAGSSGGALRALLLQDAANKAAESSSALGVQTAAQYGGINTNFAQVLEALTRSNPAATEALLQALGVAKGAESTTTGTVNTTGTSTQNVNTAGTTSQQTNASRNTNTDYAPFHVSSAPSSGITYYGPTAGNVDSGKYVGTTMDTLSQLADMGNPWNSYTF